VAGPFIMCASRPVTARNATGAQNTPLVKVEKILYSHFEFLAAHDCLGISEGMGMTLVFIVLLY
jgi:hypothetical protein